MIQDRLELPRPWSASPVEGAEEGGALLASWMNQDYLADTWKQAWPAERWTLLLQEHAARPDIGSFVVKHESQTFAYIEVYELVTSVLSEHGDWAKGDLGFHFAVVEPRLLHRGLARQLMHDLCQTLFEQYPDARRIGVEPDIGNEPIARLFEYTGFTRVRPIQLPHKVAALMVLPRSASTAAVDS